MIPEIINLGVTEIITVALGGIIGALVKDCLQDGALQLPYINDGKLFVGFLGSGLVGAFIGIVIDGSFITAALAGYTGASVLTHLLNTSSSYSRTLNKNKNIEELRILVEANKKQKLLDQTIKPIKI